MTSIAENNRPEIPWSIMHPTQPDAGYMRRVIAEAAHYHVDSFEICGDAHGASGNLDGAILFRDYPEAARHVDRVSIEKNIRTLREVAELSHRSNRPVYY